MDAVHLAHLTALGMWLGTVITEVPGGNGLGPATEFLADNREIIAFKLLSVKPMYRYEIAWDYK